MDSPGLLSFPLPMLTALLCCVIAGLVWRLNLGARRSSVTFAVLFGLCALEAGLVGVRFGYGTTALIPVQRVLPLFLGPLMYLGFAALTRSGARFTRSLALHLGAPVLVMGLFWALSRDLRQLDWVISASYVVYIVALARLWRGGPDALTHARVGVARSLNNWILRGIGLLGFVLSLDTAIAVDFAVNQGVHVTTLISYGTVPLILVLLAILVTLPRMVAQPVAVRRDLPAADLAEAAGIERKLAALMTADQLFLDPDLTVQRLARRLHLPARAVSAAVNRTRGMNMSQYVNTFRLAHAAERLVASRASVKDIAEASGFLTRSNFYREFQRVYGMSPTAYRTARSDARDPTREA